MDKRALSWSMMVLGIVVVTGASLFYYKKPVIAPSGEESLNPVAEESTGKQESKPATNITTGGKTSVTKSGTTQTGKIALTILKPIAQTQLVLGQDNIIEWNRETGLTGGIQLLDAKTREVVGWIHVNLNPRQTSFAWDTRNIYLSRTNPLKKEIGTGNYVVQLVFDGPEASVPSQSFSIVYPSQVSAPEHEVSIQSYTFAPSQVTIKIGDKVVFINKDTIDYKINITAVGTITVQKGTSHTLDTQAFGKGTYDVYSPDYPAMVGKIVVQ
jgi:plastocyanin